MPTGRSRAWRGSGSWCAGDGTTPAGPPSVFGSDAAAWCGSKSSPGRSSRYSSTAKYRGTLRSRRGFCRAHCPCWSIPHAYHRGCAMTESLLLVDDDADVLRSVGDYFERIGHEVARAATGAEGGEALEP